MPGRRSVPLGAALIAWLFAPVLPCRAADWPMWRCDPNRSGSTAEQLPGELHLQWVLRRPALVPAWPDEPRMRFDAIYQPIVMGRTMFLASSHSDSVTAVDIRSGREKWRFHADGPVRFAPAGWKDAVFVASDDGHLYCLDAATGRLRWKFRGGPGKQRLLLGNERLISAWPVRGGPVVLDGPSTRSGRAEVYFAAGIWPFMGVFVYALDAESGQVVWCNDTTGSLYVKQPHNSPAFAGLAPQGYLAASGGTLLVPNGRAAAAGLDRRTGRLLHFRHSENKQFGHCEVAVVGSHFVNSGRLARLTDGRDAFALAPSGENVGLRYSRSSIVSYDQVTGEELAPIGAVGVLAGGVSYQSGGDVIVARDVRRPITRVVVDYRGRRGRRSDLRVLWELATRAKPMLRAGDRLYSADGHEIAAFDLSGRETMPALPEDPNDPIVVVGEDPLPPPPRLCWRTKVDGTPAAMIAAGGRLFVITKEGSICCYAEREVAEPAVIES
ncbi:MAG: PQQ-binding-like beta-propeller repeat protein, partial [Phycisphaerae bacterium]